MAHHEDIDEQGMLGFSNLRLPYEAWHAAAIKSHLHIHKSKLGLFSSLSRFLEAGLSKDNQDPYWFLSNYLANSHAKKVFRITMNQYAVADSTKTVQLDMTKPKQAYAPTHPMFTSVAPYLSEQGTAFSHLHLFGSSGPKATTSSSLESSQQSSEFSADERFNHVRQLIETFQPILVASWLEAAPSVFMSSAQAISMTPDYDPAGLPLGYGDGAKRGALEQLLPDGLHLSGGAYRVFFDIVKDHISLPEDYFVYPDWRISKLAQLWLSWPIYGHLA